MTESTERKKHTFICSRGTLDGAYPSLILGINSQRLGYQAHVFYTFMGIYVVKQGYLAKLKFHPQGFMGAIPGMSTLATGMMKKQIDEAGMPDIEELLEMASLEGVRLVACKMTMDMMKMGSEDLLEGVEVMNAEEYLKLAEMSSINMFT
jgi:peroxiredoxin family protein